MTDPRIQIYDIMACNVYWDFENSPMPKETHKMLVALYPTPDVAAPDMIEKITAYGPDGYEAAFANQKYQNDVKNGWFYTPEIQNYWYMVNLPDGFLKEGEYTIEVISKDGSVSRKSRVQDNGPSDAAVEAYLKNYDAIFESFSPSKAKPLGAGAGLKDVKLNWSVLSDFGGPDAFYVTRLAQASTPMNFDGNNLTMFDNIYVQRLYNSDPGAGKNRGEVIVDKELDPGTDYGYFVEITDANIGGDANICIFQPHQFFKTP
ncbi:hypothetical protein SAMN02745216_03620 [Desulfatibacillum alkenivorans DSM 16219]|jgi:hypothetical protein|uniref:Uncharacterized protein n=1 Tax=Desulfatibacillum alkenivorans DSM 16219 TaxID=1121393 RepID=A0A1M6T709_9BACT|nr:hypothetical protein [Desulfatibacillum alkenivorans]SHK52725.1 hypothetical protein SAMN02745216_03620 [Desulfatibacillum alkenivorans DSM 16219]